MYSSQTSTATNNNYKNQAAKFYVHWMNNKELNFNIASEAFFIEVIEKLRNINQTTEIDEIEIENNKENLNAKGLFYYNCYYYLYYCYYNY